MTLTKLIPTRLFSGGPMGEHGLTLSLAIAALLALNGLWWGWVESWNPDDWALVDLLSPDRAPLEPASFVKPPFHTYLNFFLSVLPIRATQKAINTATSSRLDFRVAILYWSRLIQVSLF